MCRENMLALVLNSPKGCRRQLNFTHIWHIGGAATNKEKDLSGVFSHIQGKHTYCRKKPWAKLTSLNVRKN